MASPFHILFTPHSHNNHKAKILWNQSLLVLIGIYIMGLSFIDISIGLNPGVLGYASQIDPKKIIELTNNQRLNANVGIVKENPLLNAAAEAKVKDMFANNYWAHISPKGTEPWYFISTSGYKYQHAGENLARDFSNPKDVVAAWMASATHKKNLIDKRYQDIGVAVKDGYINGVETTIVVQLFGTTPNKATVGKIASDTISVDEVFAAESTKYNTGISPMSLSKIWSIAFLIVILGSLSLDWIFVLRYNLIRISGKTWAHLTFMWFVAIAVFVIKQGIVL